MSALVGLLLALLATACGSGPASPSDVAAAPTPDVTAHADDPGGAAAADRIAGGQLQQILIPRPAVTGWQGAVLDPAVTKPAFTLTDTDGQPFDLRASTADAAVTYLYFGYTTCPDICPTHMAALASALRLVPEDIAEQVRVVFVSVDPERDAPLLRRYLDSFDPSFVGLTGTPEEVNQAMRDLGVAPSAIAEDGAFPPSHPVNIVAFSGDEAHLAYPFGVHGGAIAEDLERLIAQGPPT